MTPAGPSESVVVGDGPAKPVPARAHGQALFSRSPWGRRAVRLTVMHSLGTTARGVWFCTRRWRTRMSLVGYRFAPASPRMTFPVTRAPCSAGASTISQQRDDLDLAWCFHLPQGPRRRRGCQGQRAVGRIPNRALRCHDGQDPRATTIAPAGDGVALPWAAIFVGLDARLRALVFSSDAKHMECGTGVGLAVGPLVHYVLGPIVPYGAPA